MNLSHLRVHVDYEQLFRNPHSLSSRHGAYVARFIWKLDMGWLIAHFYYRNFSLMSRVSSSLSIPLHCIVRLAHLSQDDIFL